MALNLASAVTTCLSAGRLAAHFLDVLLGTGALLTLAPVPVVTSSGTGTAADGRASPLGSACPSRNATARFRNEPSRNMQARQSTLWTIGHSTRPIDEFIGLLRAYQVGLLVDVRTVPRSRYNPQFNMDTLAQSLRDAEVRYRHLPELGGLRKPKKDSINDGWRNASFRGYADYMQTEEFQRALEELMAYGTDTRMAVMCAEAVPWRCHRSLIADALVSRGWDARHIMSPTQATPHVIASFANFEKGTLIYPKPTNSPSLF
jgi:hypothetical protein